ncbi:aminotransferase class I/II-fold pyridoxal phosphate-dependent enzyme [Clostridium tyrobutyricum]|jgi:arginine/lysine/ornithine decarboxylase|uniref:Arginine decarboxylase Lysine decarboxylase Ornithine decarboxylase n=1 Tax=Clostridium tyrobutyricum DIVETGP TaxID=1408889 RepID=W6NEZ7_CLOTY|nr:aminotransferase class I/II-fold pyridoxal phosphate-dependent enzyme [Clostridium tyrobutyricum]AND84121.1 Orn/Lys/Arg decarboxylase [Clostridium tyrobutyricum]ANP68848.1 arginine decarboxylase [Clostridium tyrobutyricum]MBR9649285.1 aminotransferase class I/II-fold pyridoxal phosphate-dependent enzyme [Clostridium tyrobutyricum]MBV4415846.1 aminotransferase class I/II-fold pyridoxal phosphate-dependent enzyme [Clostridium tyrobutyricum]MBV4421889.1 aminotransferase class I/II-fold pyridox
MYKLDQNETPLFDALMEYVKRETIPFHVPGHKKGVGADAEFKAFIGENPFKIDVTVFKSVDSLHHPTGPIKRAQELAADAYGSDAAFFSIHGTSGAIQAMIMSVVNSGDKIIIPRNVHKSVTAGIILSGAIPVYMQPKLDKRVGIAHGVTPETVAKSLEENSDAKAVLIINPTYYGVAADIKKIATIVHSYDIPLIVDEAHGPHLSFNKKLPLSSMDAGSDMCCQSTHKIIGALTQASLLHVNSERVDVHRVQQVLSLLQTTSPSYILMASLDCARRQIAINGKELLDKAIDLANYVRCEINKISGLYCFGEELLGNSGVYSLDPTKITITCRDLGITGYDLDMILSNKYHIQMELSDIYNVLAVGSFGDTRENMDALINALKEISREYFGNNTKKSDFLDVPDIPRQIKIPRDAFNAKKEAVSLKNSVGMISGEFLMAYPPGIPVLCPGEEITKDIVDYVKQLKEAGLYVQGTEDPEVEYIKVVK